MTRMRNSVRMIESPPFEVEETGWGEFEIAIKFYFAPESTEKPQQIWHGLKLHPYQGDVEQQKRDRTTIYSVCYEEVLFNEPVEHFYDMLTGGVPVKGKAGKGAKGMLKSPPSAEIPDKSSKGNKFSREEESKELDRLGEAVKEVEKLELEEKEAWLKLETELDKLEQSEGKPNKRK